jgi:hypothetical protein
MNRREFLEKLCDILSPMLNSRQLLMSAVAPAVPAHAAPPSFQLCMHQTTSAAAGYRNSLEGYARAGIKYVEVVFPQLDPFVTANGIAVARRLLSETEPRPRRIPRINEAAGFHGG